MAEAGHGVEHNGLELPRHLLEQLVAFGRREAPLEACGLLAGRQGKAERFLPARNAEESMVRYRIAPQELFELTMDIEKAGEELVAIFHTHPATEPYPSQTDLKEAHYPTTPYLILSLRYPDEPELRGYYLTQDSVRSCPITISD